MEQAVLRPTYGIIPAQNDKVGNMNIRRAIATRALRQLSPFVLFDHMGPRNIPAGDTFEVPPHPHAGFQTVTYFLQGVGYHKDSLGNTQSIQPGDVNWMTAGKGIVHAEYSDPEFNKKGGPIEGFQIWVDLPAEARDTEPLFGNYTAAQLPLKKATHSQLRIIAGAYEELKSPVETFSPVHLYHLSGKKDKYTFQFAAEHNHGVYLAGGKATVNNKELIAGDLLVMKKGEGLTKIVLNESEAADLMILAGQDLGSGHVSYGPFIANNAQHLQEQVQRYQNGAMGNL